MTIHLLNYHFSSVDSPITKPVNNFESKVLSCLPVGYKLFKTPGVQRGDIFAQEGMDVYRIQNEKGSFMDFIFQGNSCMVLMFALPVSEQGKFGVARGFFRGCCSVIFAAGIRSIYGQATSNAQPTRKVRGRDWRERKTKEGETRLAAFYSRLGLLE